MRPAHRFLLIAVASCPAIAGCGSGAEDEGSRPAAKEEKPRIKVTMFTAWRGAGTGQRVRIYGSVKPVPEERTAELLFTPPAFGRIDALACERTSVAEGFSNRTPLRGCGSRTVVSYPDD